MASGSPETEKPSPVITRAHRTLSLSRPNPFSRRIWGLCQGKNERRTGEKHTDSHRNRRKKLNYINTPSPHSKYCQNPPWNDHLPHTVDASEIPFPTTVWMCFFNPSEIMVDQLPSTNPRVESFRTSKLRWEKRKD